MLMYEDKGRKRRHKRRKKDGGRMKIAIEVCRIKGGIWDIRKEKRKSENKDCNRSIQNKGRKGGAKKKKKESENKDCNRSI